MSINQRLYPTPAQEKVLIDHSGQARWVWNNFLRKYSDKVISYGEFSKYLTYLRSFDERLRGGPASMQQAVLRDLQSAITRSKGGDVKFPKFKRVGSKRSFPVRDSKVFFVSDRWGTVTVPKVGRVRFRLTVPFSEVSSVKTARVKQTSGGRWVITFRTGNLPPLPPADPGSCVGIDVGVANSFTLSTGEFFSVPKLTKREKFYLSELQSSLTKQEKGSNRRESTKRRMGKLTETVYNRRLDFLEKLTTVIAREYRTVVLEDIKISSLVKRPASKISETGEYELNGAAAKTGLNNSILESNWGKFRERLEDKVTRSGGEVIYVSPMYTSQECSSCGEIDSASRVSQAKFLCTKCGFQEHADINAAKNILRKGLSMV